MKLFAKKIPTTQQEKNDFFLVVAHELRTSLTAMKWSFKMLSDQEFGPLTKEQSEILTRVTDSNQRLINLVNELLLIAHTDKSSIDYAAAPVSLNELVEESIKNFISETAHKGMDIKYEAPTSPIMVTGDKSKLTITIHNLIENAIKYGMAHTSILITLTSENGKAIFTITDNGITIPKDDQSSIFKKFFRASNAKDSYAGIGAGLYISKHIIEHHGGLLTFTSSPEHGTIFTITLPSK